VEYKRNVAEKAIGRDAAHMPKPCNHKYPSKIEPTTKGTRPISYGLLALFAFPLLNFYKESSCFLKLLFSISF
jgi:hypothetical protein